MSKPEFSTAHKKSKLALAVAEGVAIPTWAKENGVPRRTAYRWASSPDVRAVIAKVRRRATDRLVGHMSSKAYETAVKICALGDSANSESVKLSALRLILSTMIQVSEYTDLQDRVTKLEERDDERARASDSRKAD